MYIIKVNDVNFWTDEYKKNPDTGFIEFQTKTKTGRVFKHQLNPSSVLEITEMDEEKKEE